MNLILKHNLANLFNKNTIRTQQAILDKIRSSPSASDKKGFVYGFYAFGDNNSKSDFKIKLGRTEKSTPAIRIAEWNGQEVFSKRTILNKKLERLIHLFFKFAYEEKIGKNESREIEWFHFKATDNINENTVIRYVTHVDDLLNEVHSDEPISVTNINRSQLSPKQYFPMQPQLQAIENVSENISERLNSIIKQHDNSSYFHVGNRRYVFNELKKCFNCDKDGNVISLEKQKKLLSIIDAYNSSCYFHVGPRREIFNAVKLYL